MNTPAFCEPTFASSLFKLLRLRLTILFNGFRRAKGRKKVGCIFLAFGLMAFIAFLLGVSAGLLGFLRSDVFAQYAGNVVPFLESFPSLVMTIAGFGILFTSFGALLQTLYLSGDMDFLMSTPVPVRAIFVAKMTQAILPNFLILCLVVLPPLFGLGISSGYNFIYYPLAIIVLVAIAFAAASMAGLLVLVVARFFRPQRVAEVMGFVLGLSIFISSQSMGFIDPQFSHMSGQRMNSIAQLIEHSNASWSPLAWAGRGLVHLGKAEWISGLALLIVPLALSVALFCVTIAASQSLYYTGWARLQAKKSKTKTRVIPAAGAAAVRQVSPLFRLAPAPVRAIVGKDLRLCIRDLSNLTGLLFPLILGIVYAIGLIRTHWQMPAGRGTAPTGFIQAGNSLLSYGDIALALLVGWMIVSNLAGLAFTREGKNFWMLKASPASSRQMLAGKFLVAYIPSALLCTVYVLVLEILKLVDAFSILISLVSVWMLVAGLCGIYLAFGARGARFDWENPAQRNRSVGCLGFLMGLIFLPVCFALFIGPALIAQVFHFPVILGRVVGLALGGAANAAAVLIPLALVEKRVAILNET